MIEESATVVSINQETVTVESQVKSSCSSCQQVDNCGSGQVAKAIPLKKLTVDVFTKLPVNIGDSVVLGLPESDLLQVAWQVYLWPVFGLLLFSGGGQWLVQQAVLPHEIFAIILGFSGGYLGYRMAKFSQKSTNNSTLLQPEILRIMPQTISVTEIHP